MRTFIALLLPPQIKTKIALLVSSLSSLPINIKWVEEENYHLTLKFLGELPKPKIEEIEIALANILSKESPFSLNYGGWGIFPNRKKPRVIWLGLGGNIKKLQDLQKTLEQTCAACGLPKENKPFHPHITLGRIRSAENISLLLTQAQKILPEKAQETFIIEELHLMESRLSRSGPTYFPLHVYHFGR